MTRDEMIQHGWTFELEFCYACNALQEVPIPPFHEPLSTSLRPKEEYESAEKSNSYSREQTEHQKNEKV